MTTNRTGLGEFLRARREHLTPTDVGLRDTGRRRTPGLRREEVATLAGVSIDYLVRLEQGRDTNPSREVMSALADTLRLNEAERRHFAMLVAAGDTPELCPTRPDQAGAIVPDTVRQLFERLQPTPAFVVGPYGDVLGWNAAWGDLVGPLGLLDDIAGDPPNLARFVFEHPGAPTVYADWDAAADEQAGVLRRASVLWREDARFTALLDDLRALAAFEQRWSRHAVEEKRRGTKTLHHPDLGPLHLAYEVLVLADEDGQRLITWLPADDATAAVLDPDHGKEPVSPARLRVVGES